MKQMPLFLLFFLFAFSVNAQEITTLNLGETKQENYYVVIPYETISGVPIIRVQIDGSEYSFMFDTGAITCISQEIIDKIKPETLLEKLSVTDNSAKVDSLPVYNLSGIMIDTVQFNDIPVVLFNESTVKTCLKIDGIVGSNLLRNSIVRFSTSDQTIIITDQPEKFDLQLKEEYCTEIFLTPFQSAPYIWTVLIDKDTATVQLMFDSGMVGLYDLALDHLNLFMEHDIFSEKPSVAEGSLSYGFLGKNDDTLQCRLRVSEVNICNSALKNPVLFTTPAADSRIGMELLDHGTVTIDYINSHFYFEPSSKDEKEKDLYRKVMPLSLSMEDGKLIIGTIWDEELSEKISVGDRVLSIDDTNFENMNECEIFVHHIYDDKEAHLFRLRAKDGTETEILIEER